MQIVKLNLIPGGVLPVCFASQNDTGRVIRFLLFEGENVFTLSGAESIALRLQKPDGSELVESVTNTGADYVDVVTTADTCDTAGASVGEIVITDGGDVLGSANFGLFVESDAFDSSSDIVIQTATGAIATFETNIETAFASLTAEINPVQSGTGTPSPQNVRPISGFSALNVTRTGVNLWDEQWEVGYISVLDGTNSNSQINIRSKNYIPIKPNVSLYLKANIATVYCPIIFYDKDKNFISSVAQTLWNRTITTPENAYYMRFYMHDSYGTTYNNDISINYPSSDTEYHAYNGQTATVNFGQTVYGGVADVTNGKVTVNDIYLPVTANYFSGIATTSGVLRAFTTPQFTDRIISACDCLDINGDSATVDSIFIASGRICVTPAWAQSVTTIDEFKNLLASNPINIVISAATPIEIDTTAENLTAIVGQNNVYTDTNGDTEVEYYIEV